MFFDRELKKELERTQDIFNKIQLMFTSKLKYKYFKNDDLLKQYNTVSYEISKLNGNMYKLFKDLTYLKLNNQFFELKYVFNEELYKEFIDFMFALYDSETKFIHFYGFFNMYHIRINDFSPKEKINNILIDFLIENDIVDKGFKISNNDLLCDMLISHIDNKYNVDLSTALCNKNCDFDYEVKTFFPYINYSLIVTNVDIKKLPKELLNLLTNFNSLRNKMKERN